MAKNTRDNNFRKIHVEDFDEDNFVDDAVGTDFSEAVSQRASQVRKLLSAGDKQEALQAALQDPPQACTDEAVKTKNFETVMEALTSFKTSEISKAVAALAQDDVDVLMKYLYKAMQTPKEGVCNAILAWHGSAVTVGGLGSIVRVLTDRNTV